MTLAINKMKLTLEELRQLQAEYEATRDRQHGKKPAVFKTEAEEYTQLYNNLKSREARKRRADYEKRVDSRFKVMLMSEDSDADGITPKDERRYRGCFKCRYKGERVETSYVKMMTGLSLAQIYIMQERTGLIPYPPVTKKVAKKDSDDRWERGEYL